MANKSTEERVLLAEVSEMLRIGMDRARSLAQEHIGDREEHIYYTARFRASHESNARLNLTPAIARLNG